MKRVAIRDNRNIFPFNEPARDLRILNKPLKVHQRDCLVQYCDVALEYDRIKDIPPADDSEMLVYQDNLFFDESFIRSFIRRARASKRACRVSFARDDLAITKHAVYLQEDIQLQDDVYVGNMWYFPHGVEDDPHTLLMRTDAREIGYYHVPTYMADEKGEIVQYVPMRAFLSIEHWYHVFVANTTFGIFAEGARFEARASRLKTRLKVLLRGMWERKQVLSTSGLVVVGKNTSINPTARIQGPTWIGDNCYIGPGVVIQNSIIGNNVNLMQGVQVMLSVVSDNCYLPFRAAVMFSTLMERCTVAQNACLQLCVLGRGTFVGAGTTFTDFNLIPKPMSVMRNGKLEPTGTTVMGSCVGHNCRIGAGLLFYPGRAIESDTVLVCSDRRSVVDKNVSYAQSDHHTLVGGQLHRPLYRPEGREDGGSEVDRLW
jgi:carbonic anhydrase/acetyltransferase-like protein (isoleucine patch superfamily)